MTDIVKTRPCPRCHGSGRVTYSPIREIGDKWAHSLAGKVVASDICEWPIVGIATPWHQGGHAAVKIYVAVDRPLYIRFPKNKNFTGYWMREDECDHIWDEINQREHRFYFHIVSHGYKDRVKVITTEPASDLIEIRTLLNGPKTIVEICK